MSGFETPPAFLEVHATCGPDYGATAMDNARDRRPIRLHNVIAAVNHALVAFTNEVDLALRNKSTQKKSHFN